MKYERENKDEGVVKICVFKQWKSHVGVKYNRISNYKYKTTG